MKKYFLLIAFFIAVAGCKKNTQKPVTPPVQPPADTTVSFKIEVKNNPGMPVDTDIHLNITGDSVKGVVPNISNKKTFAITFSPANANMKINGIAQHSGTTVNDFSKPLTYTYTNAKGVTRNYRISITNFTGIPIFYITSSGPIVSEDDYVTGSLSVNPNGQFNQDTTAIPLKIRGRGNSTWDMPKKPYKMKFSSSAPLLGLPTAKTWVLLANYSDKTLIRNAVALAMGQQFNADFTSPYRMVDVVLNGTYIGNYTLTQQMEVDPNRVNIPELGSSDISPDVITGGYLLELDQRLDADFYFYSHKGLPFTLQSPDPITDEQLAYITNYVNDTEDALFSANFADPVNGYAKYINVDSFIDWYLVKEIMKDNDAKDFSSIYYYKDRNGKLSMGPIWDFDLSGGNTDYSDCQYPTGWWIRDATWFSQLFKDPAFHAKVKARWAQLKTTAIPAILTNIDKDAAYINLSQQENFKVWQIMGVYVWPNAYVGNSYPDEVNYLKTWLQTRINWMDTNM